MAGADLLDVARGRAALRARLEARRGEIEEAALARVNAIANSAEVADPAYVEGLRRAVGDGLAYALELVGRGGQARPAPLPVALLAQARLAARSRVSLDTVLRRYFAAYTLLGHFLIEEAEELKLPSQRLRGVLDAQAGAFDRLLAAVSEEYARESHRGSGTVEELRAQHVRRLLAGEPVDTAELNYRFEAHHLGILGAGEGAERAVRELAAAFDRSLLLIRPDRDSVWAWLGGRSEPQAAALSRRALEGLAEGTALAIGEPAKGLSGWRLTHRQAAAALPIAVRLEHPRLARYRDVALLASVAQDDLLATSLRRLYLDPLEHGRDGGAVARQTLRAYFAAERNVSAAAAALGVNRNTVGERIRAIEATIGRPLSACGSELEVTLHLAELDGSAQA